MAVRKIYFGSVGPFLYEDTELVNDQDGDFPGITRKALLTDGDIYGEIGEITGLTLAVVTIYNDYTVADDISTVYADAVSHEIIVTLPTAVGINGRLYTIKKTDATANKVIIDGAGIETIDGELTIELLMENDAVQVQSNGTSWLII